MSIYQHHSPQRGFLFYRISFGDIFSEVIIGKYISHIMNTTIISDNDEGSKRITHFFSRIAVTLAVAMVAFGGFGPLTATAEAPDQIALARLQRGIEDYFVTQSHELLTREERAQYIRDYFDQWNLPGVEYADEFVLYAEKYNIDWRLAPAIAFRESTFCKYTIENHAITKRKNNCFGWGNMSFDSIEEGIAYVSRSLGGENPATAQYYADKDLRGKLLAYNSVIPDYYDDIVRIMDNIYDDTELLRKSVAHINT
ncbi:glucosaminidase domain-containing protein [Candidatus Nomurabacteria bacterium]|nr:glucosaminidase domain-containing protein [Candidatus Nomurabacteria bacterium]